MTVIDIACSEDCEPPPWRDSLQVAAERALADMALVGAEVSILLCGEETIRRLNARFRGVDASTDVLTFPQYEGGYDYREGREGARREGEGRESADAGRGNLGDVVIAVPVAARAAERNGRSEWEEALELMTHGLLHIVGFDHCHEGNIEHDCMILTQRHLYRGLLAG